MLALSHFDSARKVAVLDLSVSQTGRPKFNPRHAVAKFGAILREWGISTVTGDAYGGEKFRADFRDLGVTYIVSTQTTSENCESLEPRLNAGEVELLDVGSLQGQLLTLVWRGTKIDHQSGDHDDWAAACAGAIWLASSKSAVMTFSREFMARAAQPVTRCAHTRFGAPIRYFSGNGNQR